MSSKYYFAVSILNDTQTTEQDKWKEDWAFQFLLNI